MHPLLSLFAMFAVQFAVLYFSQHHKNTIFFTPQLAATGVEDLAHDEEAADAIKRFVGTFKNISHNITASQNVTDTSEGFSHGAATVQPTEVAAFAISPPLVLIGIIALLLCFLAIWHILKADSLESDIDGCYDDHVSPIDQVLIDIDAANAKPSKEAAIPSRENVNLENECWSAWMNVDIGAACYDWLDTYRRYQLQRKDEELKKKRKMFLDALEKKDKRDAWRKLVLRTTIKLYERRHDKLKGEKEELTEAKWDLKRRMSAGNYGYDSDERLRKESDEVLRKSKELLEDYQELLQDHQELQEDDEKLLLKYTQVREELRRLREAFDIPDDSDSDGDGDDDDDLDPSAGPSNSPTQPEPSGGDDIGGDDLDPDETGSTGGASPASGSPPTDSDGEKKSPSEGPEVVSPSDEPPSSPHTSTSKPSNNDGAEEGGLSNGSPSTSTPTMPRSMQRKELRKLGAPTGPVSMRGGFSRPTSTEPFNRGPPTNGYGNGYGPSASFNRRPPTNGYGPRPTRGDLASRPIRGGFPAGTPRPVTRPAQPSPAPRAPQIPRPQSTTPKPDEVDFFARPAQRRPDPQAPQFSPAQPTTPKPGKMDFSIEPGLKGWTGK